MTTVDQVLQDLERRAPAATAESWDNVGLLVGDPSTQTSGAVVSIDLTAQAVRLAQDRGYKLIVNHHPCIFPKGAGLQKVVAGSPIYDCVRSGISVIAKHTCFDQCALEVVDGVSKSLGVRPLGRLFDRPEGELIKLAVFVPEEHVDSVHRALMAAGAGHIGRYDSCAFQTPGVGTFRGLEGAQPAIGKVGQLEKVNEIKLETVMPVGLKESVLRALREAHPYEEVAFDLYPVEQSPPQGGIVRGLGYGFWGDFDQPIQWSELNKRIHRTFGISGFWSAELPMDQIGRIAFVAGKGGGFLNAAQRAGCQVLITGEAGYHTVLDGMRRGVRIIEVGHRESELFFLRTQESWLKNLGLETQVLNDPTQRIWVKGEPA